MTDFAAIKEACQRSSKISEEVIDNFLMYYAAGRERLEPEMNQRFARYKHITRDFPEGAVNKFKAQYIVHKIFRKGGLIRKLLNHRELKLKLGTDEMAFLAHHEQHPWRFSFSEIVASPARDFYEMEDAFTGEVFLLYSPGITHTLREENPKLWFNLIAFNGACWQTYGPIAGFNGFQPDDVFFFATELRPDKTFESDEALMQDVEQNPVPYMMLCSGSHYPLVVNKGHQMIICLSTVQADTFEMRDDGNHFRALYSNGVYKYALKRWSSFPHYAALYYEEEKHLLTLHALTERGFSELVSRLNASGYAFEEEPYVRVNPAMVSTAEDILRKKIPLQEYDKLFETTPSEAGQDALVKMNRLLDEAVPMINAGKKPDVAALAKAYGVDEKVANQMIQHLLKLTRG